MFEFDTKHIKEVTVSELLDILEILKTNLLYRKMTLDKIIEHVLIVSLCRDSATKRIIGIGTIKKRDNIDFKTTIFKLANRMDINDDYTNELGYLWTDKQFRRSNIATSIIHNLINRYTEKNTGKIFATVKAENIPSLQTLIKSGFNVSISPIFNIENFVNPNTNNVLKLLLHDRTSVGKQGSDEDKNKHHICIRNTKKRAKTIRYN